MSLKRQLNTPEKPNPNTKMGKSNKFEVLRDEAEDSPAPSAKKPDESPMKQQVDKELADTKNSAANVRRGLTLTFDEQEGDADSPPRWFRVSVHVSILTLMVVAGDRYIAILHPIKSRVVKRNAWLVIAVVWLFSTAINIPLVIYYHYLEHTWPNGEIRKYCFEHWGIIGQLQWKLAKEMYTLTVFVCVYVVPLVLMSVAYVRIGMTLSYRSISGPGVSVKATISVQDKARKKVVKMMLVVVITFALCWLPYHIYNLYAHFRGFKSDWDIFTFIIWLGYANSAMNPFIYCGFNENFRRGFRDAFTGRWCRKQTSHHKFPTGATTKSVTTTMFTHSDHIDPTSMESML